MANSNTTYAQHKGYSGLVQMGRGTKDWCRKWGTNFDTHTLRQKSGKKAWSPPKIKKGSA